MIVCCHHHQQQRQSSIVLFLLVPSCPLPSLHEYNFAIVRRHRHKVPLPSRYTMDTPHRHHSDEQEWMMWKRQRNQLRELVRDETEIQMNETNEPRSLIQPQ